MGKQNHGSGRRDDPVNPADSSKVCEDLNNRMRQHVMQALVSELARKKRLNPGDDDDRTDARIPQKRRNRMP